MTKLRESNYAAAEEILEKAARDMPLNASVQCNLGIASWKLGRTDQAVEALQKAASSTGCDARPLEFLGQVLMAAGDLEEAREIFAEAHERLADSPRILTSLGVAEIRTGKDGMARFQQALAIQPGYAPALYNMAVALRDHAAALPPSSTQAKHSIEQAADYCTRYIELMESRADTATPTDIERLERARKLLRTLTGAGIATASPPPKPPSAMLQRARRAIAQQAYEAALILLKEAIKADPKDADALWELATVYEKHLKYPDSADRTYAEFRKKFPDDPRAGPQDPQTPPPQGASPPAANTATAIQLFAKGHEAHKKGDWDSAIDYYKRALRMDPTYSAASYNLGLIYFDGRKDMGKARDAFLLAIAQQKNMTKAHYMLGLVYSELGDQEKAIAQLNNALRGQPNYARAHFALGQIYRTGDQLGVAEMHLKRYLQYEPQGPYTARARLLLREIAEAQSAAARKPPMPR